MSYMDLIASLKSSNFSISHARNTPIPVKGLNMYDAPNASKPNTNDGQCHVNSSNHGRGRNPIRHTAPRRKNKPPINRRARSINPLERINFDIIMMIKISSRTGSKSILKIIRIRETSFFFYHLIWRILIIKQWILHVNV